MRPIRADLRVTRPDGRGGQVVDVPTDEEFDVIARKEGYVKLSAVLDILTRSAEAAQDFDESMRQIHAVLDPEGDS